jgi:hypothetical protein
MDNNKASQLENQINDPILMMYYKRSQGKKPDAGGMESACYFYDDIVFKKVNFRLETAERFKKTQELLKAASANGKRVPEIIAFAFDFSNPQLGKVEGLVLERKMVGKPLYLIDANQADESSLPYLYFQAMEDCLKSNCNYSTLLRTWKEFEEIGLSLDPNGSNFLIDDSGDISFIDLKCTHDVDKIDKKRQVINMLSCFLPMGNDLDTFFKDAPDIIVVAKKGTIQLAEKIKLALSEAGFEENIISEVFKEEYFGIEKATKEFNQFKQNAEIRMLTTTNEKPLNFTQNFTEEQLINYSINTSNQQLDEETSELGKYKM